MPHGIGGLRFANPPYALRATGYAGLLPESEVILDGKSGVLKDFGYQATAYIARVNWDRDRYLTIFMPKRQMTSRLTVFHETLTIEKANQITRRELRQSRHTGIPTVSSST